MAIVLISNPTQINNQCEAINVIMVPNPKLRIVMERINGFISRGRILTNMFGVWAQELKIS